MHGPRIRRLRARCMLARDDGRASRCCGRSWLVDGWVQRRTPCVTGRLSVSCWQRRAPPRATAGRTDPDVVSVSTHDRPLQGTGRLIAMDMKSAVSRELRRRGQARPAPLTSDDDDSESSDLEVEKPEAAALLRGAEALRPCGKWLQSSNNRSAACAVASAVSGVVFVCTGHPHLAVKCCVSFALLSIFCGLPQSDEDQAKEDKLLRQLHKSGM